MPKALPCSVKSANDSDRARAIAILSDPNNYMVRYLRTAPVVAKALVPVRNKDGAVIEDAEPAVRRVICSGTPFATMIAFQYSGDLYIGWSKRLDVEGEVSFSKEEGKILSVIRGLHDSLHIGKENMTSEASEVIPKSLVKALPSFVDQAITAFGGVPRNVSNHKTAVTTPASSSLAMP